MASENRCVRYVLMSIIVCLSFVTNAIGGRGRGMNDNVNDKHVVSVDLENEEDEDLERQLKILNKPPVKTIWMDYGDIVDCVDIYKQPAFDHPQLKNHKIQRKPSNYVIRGGAGGEKKADSHLSMTSRNPNNAVEGCPPDTVPIRRITKEGLKRYKSFMQYYSSFHSFAANSYSNHFALLRLEPNVSSTYYGAKADIDACNPKIERDDQISTGQIFVQAGPAEKANSIQSGWMVSRMLYGDSRSRFFTYWTGDDLRNGCFDLLCPGFVQVSRDVSLGAPLSNISIYGGPLFSASINITQDPATKNWWLYSTKEEIPVGYWPKNLFTYLSDGATNIYFGGRTGSQAGQITPPMGNGLIPDGDYYHSCFIIRMLVIAGPRRYIYSPFAFTKSIILDSPDCYDLEDIGDDKKPGFYAILFGGPGGNCGS